MNSQSPQSPHSAEAETDPATRPPESFPGQGALGSFLLLAGAGIGILAFIDRTAGLPFEMPRTWYATPILWYFFAFGSFLAGMMLLRPGRVHDRRWQPEVPGRRFEKIIVYSKKECHLCDQAKDVLLAYRNWLPEFEEVDITKDPELMKQFAEQIPVVKIDGQVRFRGQVNEVLLRRLINATPPKKT
jgi:glutaredoxin